MRNKKNIGIIVFYKRLSDKSCYVKILLDSSLVKGSVILIKGTDKYCVGQQVFGYFYKLGESEFFFVESVEFFLGSFFWYENIVLLQKLMKCFDKVPLDLNIEGLYEKFFECVANLKVSKKISFIDSFDSWVDMSLT